jgi:flagellar biosynthetic protein FlhB
MADSEHTGQERNLDPTGKRLEDARREGQVARSRDLSHLLLLGAAGGVLVLLAQPLMQACREILAAGLRFDFAGATETSVLTQRLSDLTSAALLAAAPVLGVLLVAALAAPLAMGGFIFVPSMAEPKFSRISPLAGFGRMFSLPSLVELAKVMLVALLLAAVGAVFLMSHLPDFAALAHEGLAGGLAHMGQLLAIGFFCLIAALAVTSAIDVPFQLFQHHRKLKMTLEEVRREEKESQGDPHIKARIRSAQRELARKRMMAAVPTADVVVTNPTHYAVALKYSDGRSAAPVVVAKGADAIAEKIRGLAKDHQVPLLSAPPLARALYRHVEIGAEIPAALYTAVAQVLAYVFQLKRWGEGRAPHPDEPHEIEVPEGMDPGASS